MVETCEGGKEWGRVGLAVGFRLGTSEGFSEDGRVVTINVGGNEGTRVGNLVGILVVGA